MLLLSYSRCLRMISEMLELHKEGGRVSHSWCMCVVSHGNGGGMDVIGGWNACGSKQGMWLVDVGQCLGGWSHVGRCPSTSQVQSDIPMTPDHTGHLITPPSWCAALGRVESKLVGLHGKAHDATRRLQLVVNASGWLHSMVLHGCCCCCLDLYYFQSVSVTAFNMM